MKQFTHKLACAAWIAAALISGTASAATLYVWQDSPNPMPPYDSWVNAATNIQDAVDVASDGDTVLVMAGVYSTGGRAVVGTMTNRVVIDKAITVESLMGPEVTVIEGVPAPGGNIGDGAIRCVYLGTNAVLSGFTLTNGFTELDFVASKGGGGGAWCESSATLTNCLVAGNSAAYGGGVHGGILYNCTLSGNRATYGGGANGSTLHKCTLTGNSAVSDNYGDGGSGGGVYGGILNNCTLTGNWAGSGGGAYGGTFYNCTLTGNSADFGGGTYDGTLYNSVMAGNSAASGGGTYGGTLFNCTVTENSASGGLFFDGGGAYGATLYNCIVYFNILQLDYASSGSNYFDCTFNYSCTTPMPTNGMGNIANAPLFVNTNEWSDLRLQSNSPCINAGDNAYVTWSTDLDDNPRIFGGTVDMGAYEHLPPGVVRFVNINNPLPAFPFTTWATAATHIQDAVDAAADGDTVLVGDGVYSTGGRTVAGTMTNRVVIDKAITVESLMGPEVAVIEGAPAPGGGVGDGAIRCAYVGTNAVLSGFTLTNGFTQSLSSSGGVESTRQGGGAWCESSATLKNCILTRNWAYDGGGAYGGTLYNCTLSKNNAYFGDGGGANYATLYNCTLTGNLAWDHGGGAYGGTLYNCALTNNLAYGAGGGTYGGTLYNSVLTGNSAEGSGGGAYGGTLYNCTITGNSVPEGFYSSNSLGGGVYAGTLYNCIVYFNTAAASPNYSDSTFNYSCTTPMPTNGVGNISVDPQMASFTHLSTSSPCIVAGNSAYATGVDIDDEPWASPPCMGADQLTPGQATGPLTLSIEAEYKNVATGFAVQFIGHIQGATLASVWNFGDGTIVSNQPITSHTWNAPGSYTVRLTGYNDSFPDGVTASVQVEVSGAVYYVNQANPTPVYPYTSWATAATNIQDAIEAGSAPGRLVLVTNGVYASGIAWGGPDGDEPGRIALTDPVQVRSVNGPEVTVIEGAPGIRCAYLENNAVLSGFTLTHGNTGFYSSGFYSYASYYGGGAYCESPANILANCIVTGNSADQGGGVNGGTLYNCILSGNSATNFGGGFAMGGGFLSPLNGALYNCTVTGNSAANFGGGVAGGDLYNCIVYFNTAPTNANYSGTLFSSYMGSYSCTTPLPANGVGNITNAPAFVDLAGGDFHLRYGSPGIDAGTNLSAILTTDLDGYPRPLDGDGDGLAAFDMGAYEFDARSLIPSDWFTSHGLDPSDPQVVSGNPDGDAFTTFQEWLAGTDPTNAASFFHIEDISKHSSAMVSFESSTNRTYTLWSTPQLAPPDWTPVPGDQAIPGNGGTLTLSDATNAPQQFYRVEVNLP